MLQKLFEGGGREGNKMIESLKKEEKKSPQTQCIDTLQGDEGVMKERDGRKAITMLSPRNSPIIVKKAI